ncbi:TonB-dependent receptor plug domain-containing protein [Lysobacter enzymogenes]|uniref:TonB-dependent receptor plug domain-containing protein n=1 Tax=Lysobacter enzymogenes TaxID=69 RepID=UPI001A97BEAC|nr:TonB-dependent receptor [Lysobacter enzymogenes]QQP96096.1 TonB-dependent receptor [Lysobacter enzymogenes]
MKRRAYGWMFAALAAGTAHAQQANGGDAAAPATDAAAQSTAPTQATDHRDAKQLDAVKVTGSLIPRAQIEGPSPVVTLTQQQIDAKGFGSVFDALRALPQANGSVQDPQFTGGYTPGAKTISLFGLPPGYTLTLLNGRPMASYPLAYDGGSNITDIANIPLSMIDRIDVLTGGQSSIYGSAAIAGVVNIVLKDRVEGTHLRLRAGGYSDGGGRNERLQFSSGFNRGKLDVSYGFELGRERPVWARQRDYIDSYYDDPTGRGAVPSRTFLRQKVGAGQTYIDPGAAACAPLSHLYGGTTGYSFRDAAGTGYYCGSAYNVGYATLSNESTNANGSLFLRYALDGGAELYADALYSYSNPTYSGGSPFWSQTFYNRDSGQYELWQRIFAPEEVGLQAKDQHVYTRSYNVTAGARGALGDSRFDYDVYYNRSQSEAIRKSTDFLARDGIDDYFLGPQLGTDAAGYKIFAPNFDRLYRPLDKAVYDRSSAVNRAYSMAWTQNLTATVTSTELFKLAERPVGFAAILKAGNEEFENNSASELAKTGYFRGVIAGTRAAGKRSQYAAGAEMQLPLLERFTANLSARYDKYSYAGEGNGKLTYKVGLEFRPTDTLLLRGSYATAFRAPDMFSLFSSERSAYGSGTDYYRCRAAGFDASSYSRCPHSGQSMLAYSSGNTALKDITAKSYTYGFVWSSPGNALSWSVDYNSIVIENEVQTLGNDDILRSEADCRLGVSENGGVRYDIDSPTCREVLAEVRRLPATDPVNPNGIDAIFTYPINVAEQRQSGIQSTLDYRVRSERFGDFAFNANYYTVLKHSARQKDGEDNRDLLCCANSNELRSRFSASATWTRGDWSATVYGLRNGKTWNSIGTARNVGPLTTYNASARYQLNPTLWLSAAVNNLSDKRPPRDRTDGNWPYFDRGNYSALGRSFWVELGLDFGS